MTLEERLRLSVLQGELRKVAEDLNEEDARVVLYAANILRLVNNRPETIPVPGLRLVK